MGTHIWVVAALLAGACATTPASEVAALRDFYGALGGDGWVDSDGWTSARDPCGGSSEPWYGITCETNASSSNATHVVGITLESNQLDGTLPASLANLDLMLVAARRRDGLNNFACVSVCAHHN